MNSISFGDFTTNLALGKLKTQTVVEETNKSAIKATHRAMIMRYTNTALIALFSRFILLEKEIRINYVPEVTHYYLRKEFAISNVTDTVPLKYLDDSFREDYDDDLLRIMTVYTEVGIELPLNDRDQLLSAFTPEFDCLQITNVHEGTKFAVTYQAIHPQILGTDPCQEIHIPYFLNEALELHVASQYFSDMGNPEQTARGQILMEKYNVLCDELETKDLVRVSESATQPKFDERGYV